MQSVLVTRQRRRGDHRSWTILGSQPHLGGEPARARADCKPLGYVNQTQRGYPITLTHTHTAGKNTSPTVPKFRLKPTEHGKHLLNHKWKTYRNTTSQEGRSCSTSKLSSWAMQRMSKKKGVLSSSALGFPDEKKSAEPWDHKKLRLEAPSEAHFDFLPFFALRVGKNTGGQNRYPAVLSLAHVVPRLFRERGARKTETPEWQAWASLDPQMARDREQ